MSNGLLISFEGLDGAGKTTQIELLERWLKSHHVPYVRTREPGGTPFGVKIRDLLLNHPELAITPLAEALLFQADRTQHFATVILPALQKGELLITDRFFDASIAYQGYARGVGAKRVKELSLLATQGFFPDLTILLDLNPLLVTKRAGHVQQLSLPINNSMIHDEIGVKEEINRLDTEAQSFLRHVQEGYRALARAHPERIKVVDASRTPEEIHQQIIELVQALL